MNNLRSKFSVTLIMLLIVYLPTRSQQMVPEFSSFEDLDVTEYVDMATGDLNFNVLLLDIPGTQGSYPIQLTYKSGIGLNQRSSWIGLGFDFEPGAIYRSISQIPDDYNRNRITVTEYDPGEEIRTDIPSFFERKIRRLESGFANARRTTVQGLWGGGIGNPASGFSGFGSLGIAAYDFSSTANPFNNLASGPLAPVFYALQVVVPSVTFPKVGNSGLSSWDYTFIDREEREKFLFLTTDRTAVFRWYLDKVSHQNAYGFLYEHNKITYDQTVEQGYFAPPFSDGSSFSLKSYNRPNPLGNDRGYDSAAITSDYYQLETGTERFNNTNPVFMAHDDYIIATPFLRGQLMPMRFDNVSISSSNISNRYHDNRIATYSYALERAETTIRPQFILKQDQSNHFNFFTDSLFQDSQGLKFETKDVSLLDDLPNTTTRLLDPLVQATNISTNAEARQGYNNGNLSKGCDVRWFTNQEISSGLARQEGFLDYKLETSRGFDLIVENHNSTQFTPEGIGGFMVKDKNGTTYHFSLPVYERKMSDVIERFDSESNTTLTITTDYNHPYAKKWILTAITGFDFKDDGDLEGIIDDNDHGYYIRFDYGKYSSDSYWRYPDHDGIYASNDTELKSHSFGDEQQYYLNSINTNSHTAIFLKSIRNDFQTTQNGTEKGDVMALSEIILLSNADYREFLNRKDLQYDLDNNANGEYSRNVLKVSDVYGDVEIARFIQEKSIRKVVLNHTYSLQDNSEDTLQGKLTLDHINFYGKKGVPVFDPLTFSYHSNPSFNRNSWDGWGYYNANREVGTDLHQVLDSTIGSAWSLSNIHTPNNQDIDISYTRDHYKFVGTESIDSTYYGGDLKVARLSKHDNVSNIEERYIFNYENGRATQEPSFARNEVNDSILAIHKYPGRLVTYEYVSYKKVSPLDEGRQLYRKAYTFSHLDENTFRFDTLVDEEITISPDVEQNLGISLNFQYGQKLRQAVYHVTYRENTLRLPLKMETFDRNNELMLSTEYIFEDSPLGTVSQASHLFDHTYRNYTDVPFESERFDYRMTYRFVNTVASYIPSRLVEIRNTDHTKGTVSFNRSLDFNFYTGQPQKTIYNDPYGNLLLSDSSPAFEYAEYQGMGLSMEGGSNQLEAQARLETYLLSPQTDTANLEMDDLSIVSLINSNVQTWDTLNTNIWLPSATYNWVGDRELNTDGTYPLENFSNHPFDRLNPGLDDRWELGQEQIAYSENSNSILVRDINNNFRLGLLDPEQERVIASVNDALIKEVGFSSAEYFNETPVNANVSKGNGSISNARTHTGEFSLLVDTDREGFTYLLSDIDHTGNKVYHASVWVHLPGETETQSQMDRVFLTYSLDGVDQIGVSPVLNESKSKNWYQLTLDIPLNGITNELKVYCKNGANRPIYFDDFRVHPLEANMISFVFDRKTDEISYQHNLDNFYIKYEYDEIGNLTTSYQEFFYVVDKVINRTNYNYSNSQK